MKVLHLEAGKHLYGGALQVLLLVEGLQRQGVENLATRTDVCGQVVDPRELVIDKRDVEIGVMNDQLRAVDKFEEIVRNLRKQRLRDEKVVSDSVDLQRTLIDGALGIDVTMEGVLSDAAID